MVKQSAGFASAQALFESGLGADAAALYRQGAELYTQELYAPAAAAFQAALAQRPTLALLHYHLARSLQELNRLDEAIAAYRQAIALHADLVEAHVELASALLLDGQLEEGFEEYAWRLQAPAAVPAPSTAELWDGMVDPQATLLLWTEADARDSIQCARYIPFIARQGMRVIVCCSAELENLMQSVEGVASTYHSGEQLPPHKAQLPLLSLPRLFATRVDKIPLNIPYLRPPFAEVQRWQTRLHELGETIKVGLQWRSEAPDGRGSVPLAMFTGLANTGKMTLVGLHHTPLTASEAGVAQQLGLVDYCAEIGDIAAAAALLANLDLIIAVDAPVLHLAGALGRPAWALLPYAPRWPWLLERDDSAWYPGVQLFRQPSGGDWQTVVDYAVSLLAEVMKISRQDQTEQEGDDV